MTPQKVDRFERNFTTGLVVYALIGCWTFGFCVAEYRNTKHVGEPGALMFSMIWPLFWPAHWSVQFWEERRP